MAMQVIYSAGTSPYASPRGSPYPPRYSPGGRSSPCSPRPSPRGVEGWRPVMPGYKPAKQTSVVIQRTVEVKHVTDSDSNLKDSIPAMSKPVAITCFICNIISPGLGTFISGLTVLCCSKIRSGGRDRMNVVWVNTWVALLQFLTAFLFLLGWIWSIMWGYSFLTLADEGEKQLETETASAADNHPTSVGSSEEDPEEVSGAVLRAQARINSSTTRTTTTTTVSIPESTQDNVNRDAPIIVLQEAPVIIHADTDPMPIPRPTRTLNPHNPRHQRILRRQNEEEIPALFLNAQHLAQIVLHSGAPTADSDAGPMKM